MSSSDSEEELRRKSTRGEAAYLREYQKGNTPHEEPIVSEWVGRVPAEYERLMRLMSEAYREDGRTFRGTELYERLTHDGADVEAAKALRDDDLITLQNIVGNASESHDLSGLRTLEKLRETLSRPAFVAYVHGHMGDGKTAFVLLLAEVWASTMRERGYEPELGSNIRTWEESDTILSFDEYMEWLERETDGSQRRLFVFDEASSHASGYASDAQEARNLLGKSINLIRKNYGSIILIGHSGMDVHKDIRRKCTYLIRKRDKKNAVVRSRTDKGDGKGELSEEMSLTGIPDTNMTFDDKEASSWEWGDQDRERHAKMLVEEYDVKQKDAAEVLDTTPRTIRRWVNGS